MAIEDYDESKDVNVKSKIQIYIDSGASSHIFHDHHCFDKYQRLTKKMPVRLGNGDIGPYSGSLLQCKGPP